MGMELGIDKKQIEAIKGLWKKWCSDPVQLRFVMVLTIAAVGYFGVTRPSAAGLAAARARKVSAQKKAAMAEDVLFYNTQIGLYEERSAVSSDISDWQNYVLGNLAHTSVQLISFEPKKTESKGPFKIIEMELIVRGQVYSEFIDFIDRLERGPRLVRLERVRVEKQQNNISLTCTVRGMVKPSATKSAGKDDDAAAGEAEPGAGEAEGGAEGAAPADEPPATAEGKASTDVDAAGPVRPEDGLGEAPAPASGENEPEPGDMEASPEAPAAEEEASDYGAVGPDSHDSGLADGSQFQGPPVFEGPNLDAP